MKLGKAKDNSRQLDPSILTEGDQMAIATETAIQLGLSPKILNASLLAETEHYQTSQLKDIIE